MGRYLCQLCFKIVTYGERHPCFFYKDDDVVYVLPNVNETSENEVICGEVEDGNSAHSSHFLGTSTPENEENDTENSSHLSKEMVESNEDLDFVLIKSSKESKESERHQSLNNDDFQFPSTGNNRLDINGESAVSKVTEETIACPTSLDAEAYWNPKVERFICPECLKSFRHKNKLVEHYRSHSGEKPFACDKCDKKFSLQCNLTQHYRTHTGEKPFACDKCDQVFSKQCNLVTHYRIHTGEKPFSCLECGKEFSRKSTLTDHLRTHSGEKPFKCSVCGKTFTQRSSLITHCKNLHKQK